jgi:hypothetical protein
MVDTKPKKSTRSDLSNAAIVSESAMKTATAANSAIATSDKDKSTITNTPISESKSKNKIGIEKDNSNKLSINTNLPNVTSDNTNLPSPKSGKKIRESLQNKTSTNSNKTNATTTSASTATPPNSARNQQQQSASPISSGKKPASPRSLTQSDYQLDYVPKQGTDRVYFFDAKMASNPNNNAISHTNANVGHMNAHVNSGGHLSDEARLREKLREKDHELDGDEIFLEKIYHGLVKINANSRSSSGHASHAKKSVKQPATNTTSTHAHAHTSDSKNYVPSSPRNADGGNNNTTLDPDRRNPECILF